MEYPARFPLPHSATETLDWRKSCLPLDRRMGALVQHQADACGRGCGGAGPVAFVATPSRCPASTASLFRALSRQRTQRGPRDFWHGLEAIARILVLAEAAGLLSGPARYPRRNSSRL